MRVAEIGDNCIDVYERIGKKYPTGNVVDTTWNPCFDYQYNR